MPEEQHLRKAIAIIEDDADIADLMRLHLEKASYTVCCFAEGGGFLRYLEHTAPDLVILDLMLPDMDGFEVCKTVRLNGVFSKLPIIIVSARCAELDKVLGFELGADDYLTKPFSMKELLVRVKALLRRNSPQVQDNGRIEIGRGAMVLDLVRHELTVRGRHVELTLTEFKILELLAQKKGWVFSRDKILRHLSGGRDKAVLDRTIDVHIRHLREKLGPEAQMIKNIRGIGYKLNDESAQPQ